MLASDSCRFIFVHIQKTGGESITRLLSREVPDLREIAAKHDPIATVEGHEEAFDGYFKFAFVRNPWDRLVAWYAMIERAARIPLLSRVFDARARRQHRQASGGNGLWAYMLRTASDFDDFVRNCTESVATPGGSERSFTRNQIEYVSDSSGEVVVDRVYRFESFAREVRELRTQIGLPPGRVPHENRSVHDHYSRYYTAETRDIVAARFARDIEYFGYEFETGGER